jgi:hypothetical protein
VLIGVGQFLRGVRQPLQSGRPHDFKDDAEGAERLPICPIDAPVSVAPDSDEASLAQHGQMLGDVSKGHVEVRGDVAGGAFAVPDESQNFAAARLSDDLQGSDASYFSGR